MPPLQTGFVFFLKHTCRQRAPRSLGHGSERRTTHEKRNDAKTANEKRKKEAI